MTPVLRVKLGLLTIGSLFAAAVAWNTAQGQIRPPVVRPPVGPRPIVRPPVGPRPIPPPPPMNPGGFPRTGPTIVNVWTCGKCSRELGRGLSAPPDHCPHCGARIINGVGNGVRQPGVDGGVAPPNPTPPPINPPALNPNPPAPFPVANNSGPTNSNPSDSSNSSGGSGKGKVIALVIGILVVGVFVLAGGTWLMIYTMKSSDPRPRRRRRRRDEEDD